MKAVILKRRVMVRGTKKKGFWSEKYFFLTNPRRWGHYMRCFHRKKFWSTFGNYFFFRGCIFRDRAISSHIHVQMTQELVRLIDLIHLKMLSIHILYLKLLENIFMDEVWVIRLLNPLKMAFLAFYKGFMHQILIKGQKKAIFSRF